MNMNDFVPNQPYVVEAMRLIKAYREENATGLSGLIPDYAVVELMADYAAAVWQEGYDDGHTDGIDEGYDQGRTDAEMEQQ